MSGSAERRSSVIKEVEWLGGAVVNEKKVPVDASMAAAMTQHAINNLGAPIYASMTDHAPVDTALAQAKTLMAIQSGKAKEELKEHATPADRAIAEALTLSAITSGKAKEGLKSAETAGGEGLSAEKVAQLQADAAAERAEREKKKQLGGGEAKEVMGGLMAEIAQQKGATISVPAGKAPEANISLNHTKTLMEIEAMKGNAIFASLTDHKPQDTALAQAQLLHAIAHKGEAKVGTVPADRAIAEALTLKALEKPANLKHVDTKESPALAEALTMQAIAHKKPSLKSVEKPADGLSPEKIAELQKMAIAEKEEEKK